MSQQFFVKTKTWIANPAGDILFGKGKTELLVHIEQTGSILKAAKAMGLNYKKAWTHLDTLQRNANEHLVTKRQGRSETSGTQLTERAKKLMGVYEQLEKDIQAYADKRFAELMKEIES